MDKEDGRKLARQAQHERRKQAVRLHRKGMAFKDIALTLGMSQGTARSAVKAANEGAASRRWSPSARGANPVNCDACLARRNCTFSV